MNILVLEDNYQRIIQFRKRFDEHDLSSVYYAQTADKALEFLKAYKFDTIFLDHDLGGKTYVNPFEHDTGTTVAAFIADNAKATIENFGYPTIIVHSLNVPAAKNMVRIINDAFDANIAYYVPFVWSSKKFTETFSFLEKSY